MPTIDDPLYTEEPTVTHDEEMYRELCKDELVKVAMIEGKGKGVIALTEFRYDDTVITEHALSCAQNMDDMRDGIVCCAMTLKSLETPKVNLLRAASAFADTELPQVDEFSPSLDIVACENADKGCKQVYSTEANRLLAHNSFHNSLCVGAMDDEQKKCYEEYITESWIQGGIDYSDTFHLAQHMLVCFFFL